MTDAAPSASVSVIMPIRDEAGHIARSLDAVLNQTYPEEKLQIVIVDGDSQDGTRRIVEDVLSSHPRGQAAGGGVSVRVLENPRRSIPVSLNLALEGSSGDVIVRVDGHCALPPDYLARCVDALESTTADCAGGVLDTIGEGPVGSAIAIAQSSVFGVGGAPFRTARSPGFVDTVAFGAYRREVFERLGGFDEELIRNQDDEFNFRLVQSGGKIWMDPRIRCVYYSRATLRRLWAQYFDYGLYKVRTMQKRRGIASARHVVPGVFVSALTLSFLGAVLSGRPTFAFTIAGPYTAANLIASLWVGRKRPSILPLLAVAYATMHVSYGCGFLAGLVRWRRYFRSTPRSSATARRRNAPDDDGKKGEMGDR